MDTKPLAGSMNPVTSNGIFEALQEKLGTEGGVITGPLELPGEPEEENQAATKGYVDSHGGGAKIFLQAEEPENWGAGDWWYQILTDDSGDDSGDDTPPEY